MDKKLILDVAIDTLSFGISAIGLQKLDLDVHMGSKDYIEYIIIDGMYRYANWNCTVPISSYAFLNSALYRILVLTAAKSMIDLALDRQGKIKQNALAIAGSEPVRLAVDSIRSKFM